MEEGQGLIILGSLLWVFAPVFGSPKRLFVAGLALMLLGVVLLVLPYFW